MFGFLALLILYPNDRLMDLRWPRRLLELLSYTGAIKFEEKSSCVSNASKSNHLTAHCACAAWGKME